MGSMMKPQVGGVDRLKSSDGAYRIRTSPTSVTMKVRPTNKIARPWGFDPREDSGAEWSSPLHQLRAPKVAISVILIHTSCSTLEPLRSSLILPRRPQKAFLDAGMLHGA